MLPRLFELLPKLIDALPHIERFSSVAERLLSSKAESAANLNALAEDIHTDLARVATGNASLSRQLDSLSVELAAVCDVADGARSVTIALGRSIVAIERQIRALRAFLIALIVLVLGLAVMVAWLLLQTHQP